MKNRSKGGVA